MANPDPTVSRTPLGNRGTDENIAPGLHLRRPAATATSTGTSSSLPGPDKRNSLEAEHSRQDVATEPSVLLKDLVPSGSRSQSFVSGASFILGLLCGSAAILVSMSIWTTLTSSATSTVGSTRITSSTWRIGSFTCFLSIFHFLEFYTHALANVPNAKTKAFLFDNGNRYTAAYSAALLECFIRSFILSDSIYDPARLMPAWTIVLGLVMVGAGQLVRSSAILEAGTNFNHIIQYFKSPTHELVTTGVYRILRHPSYFGFFWWAVGTQIVMGNLITLVLYVVILSSFFQIRIIEEEQRLRAFFHEEYEEYAARTIVGIPMIVGP